MLDLNAGAGPDALAMCITPHAGDAQQPEVLEHLGLRATRLVVITVPARTAALEIIRNVRRLAPPARIVVRARYRIHTSEFEAAGAHAVADDEDEVGRRLAEEACRLLLEPEPSTSQ
jgi:voltage-gated potassium channel Kch